MLIPAATWINWWYIRSHLLIDISSFLAARANRRWCGCIQELHTEHDIACLRVKINRAYAKFSHSMKFLISHFSSHTKNSKYQIVLADCEWMREMNKFGIRWETLGDWDILYNTIAENRKIRIWWTNMKQKKTESGSARIEQPTERNNMIKLLPSYTRTTRLISFDAKFQHNFCYQRSIAETTDS